MRGMSGGKPTKRISAGGRTSGPRGPAMTDTLNSRPSMKASANQSPPSVRRRLRATSPSRRGSETMDSRSSPIEACSQTDLTIYGPGKEARAPPSLSGSIQAGVSMPACAIRRLANGLLEVRNIASVRQPV